MPEKRRKSTFYETTLSLIAKRLHRLYPDDHFCIQATTWSRPASFIRQKDNIIKYRIWSSQLNSIPQATSAVEENTLERAFKQMCELKSQQEPRKVENFLKENFDDK